MEHSKLPVEDAIHMSLDQYISEAGILDPNGLSVKRNGHHQRHSKFHRSNNNSDIGEQDDDDEDDDDNIEMSVPAHEYFDLSNDIPNARSQQWRLMAPNTNADRPSGMPPLIVSDKVQQSLRTRSALSSVNTSTMSNGGGDQRKHISYADRMADDQQAGGAEPESRARDMKIEVDNDCLSQGSGDARQQLMRRAPNHRNHQNNQQRNQNNNRNNRNWGGSNQQRNNGGNNWNNGGGVARPNNQFKHDRLSVHNRIDHTYLDRRQPYNQHQQTFDHPPPSMPIALQRPQLPTLMASNTTISAATLTAGVAASIANATDATFVQHCMDAMPSVASKLLEQIDAMHRAKLDKKYDIKLQKEIAEVQGKQLMYTCPWAAVVSCDGPGIEVEPPQPHATDVSMNQRFA